MLPSICHSAHTQVSPFKTIFNIELKIGSQQATEGQAVEIKMIFLGEAVVSAKVNMASNCHHLVINHFYETLAGKMHQGMK